MKTLKIRTVCSKSEHIIKLLFIVLVSIIFVVFLIIHVILHILIIKPFIIFSLLAISNDCIFLRRLYGYYPVEYFHSWLSSCAHIYTSLPLWLFCTGTSSVGEDDKENNISLFILLYSLLGIQWTFSPLCTFIIKQCSIFSLAIDFINTTSYNYGWSYTLVLIYVKKI